MTREELNNCSKENIIDYFVGVVSKLKVECDNMKTTIESQEIIIKDKTAIMEAMVQPKTCDGCKHYIFDDENTSNKQWSECVLFYCETRSAGNMDDFF